MYFNLTIFLLNKYIEPSFQFFNCTTNISLYNCLFLSIILLILGVSGFINNSRNLLVFLMCLELIFLAINIILVSISVFTFTLQGQLYSLLLLAIAASEAAVGLSLLIVCYRITYTIHVKILSCLRG